MSNIGEPREAERRLVASVMHLKLLYAAPAWTCETVWKINILSNLGARHLTGYGQVGFYLAQALSSYGCFNAYLKCFKKSDDELCRYFGSPETDEDSSAPVSPMNPYGGIIKICRKIAHPCVPMSPRGKKINSFYNNLEDLDPCGKYANEESSKRVKNFLELYEKEISEVACTSRDSEPISVSPTSPERIPGGPRTGRQAAGLTEFSGKNSEVTRKNIV